MFRHLTRWRLTPRQLAGLWILPWAVGPGETLGGMQVIAMEVSPTPAYLGPPTQVWNIAGADIAAGIAVPEFGPSLFIAPVLPGSLTWTGNSLNSDPSIGGLASDAHSVPNGIGSVIYCWEEREPSGLNRLADSLGPSRQGGRRLILS